MKKISFKKKLSAILSFVLIAVIALTMVGCGSEKNVDTPPVSTTEVVKNTVVGSGETVFVFSVTHLDGKTSDFEVHTDKKTVGEALLSAELIAGEDGQYGLYVKTVDGETLDYNKDGKYWAFYENGAYASKGVDQTEITDGVKYEFKAE